MENKFFELYSSVFDDNGEVKACGRDRCRQLIVEQNKLEPGVNHGDVQTGYMDLELIKSLRERLNG